MKSAKTTSALSSLGDTFWFSDVLISFTVLCVEGCASVDRTLFQRILQMLDLLWIWGV